MRHILLAFCLAVASLATQPLAAQEVPASEIQQVIRSQIEAFQEGDIDTAFSFASPDIRAMFGTPERFGSMVRDGYPMVWRPAEVEFLALERAHGQLWQMVMMRDGAGAWHLLGYMMQAGPDGGWLIDGVQLLRQAGTAA